jgi:hypothetical protein
MEILINGGLWPTDDTDDEDGGAEPSRAYSIEVDEKDVLDETERELARIAYVGPKGERYIFAGRTASACTVSVFAAGCRSIDQLGPRDLSTFTPYGGMPHDAACMPNLYIQADVAGEKFAALPDSGCGFTLMNGVLFDALPISRKLRVEPLHMRFEGATHGHKNFCVRGAVKLPITIAGVTNETLVGIIENLGVQCLLGTDFMARNRTALDHDTFEFKVGDGRTPLIAIPELGGRVQAVLPKHWVNVTHTLPALRRVKVRVPIANAREGDVLMV